MSGRDPTIKSLTPGEQRALSERRRERRIPCNIPLGVAAYDGYELPDATGFVAMDSRDISKSGLSFFSPFAPDTDHVVLMLGSPPDVFYVTARVVRFEEGFWDRRRQFAIGCRFTGQIIYEAEESSQEEAGK